MGYFAADIFIMTLLVSRPEKVLNLCYTVYIQYMDRCVPYGQVCLSRAQGWQGDLWRLVRPSKPPRSGSADRSINTTTLHLKEAKEKSEATANDTKDKERHKLQPIKKEWKYIMRAGGGKTKRIFSFSPTFLFLLYSQWCGWLWSASARTLLPPHLLQKGLCPPVPFEWAQSGWQHETQWEMEWYVVKEA